MLQVAVETVFGRLLLGSMVVRHTVMYLCTSLCFSNLEVVVLGGCLFDSPSMSWHRQLVRYFCNFISLDFGFIVFLLYFCELCYNVLIAAGGVQWQLKMAHGSVDDLATLSELEENSLMEELLARYIRDIVYVIKLSQRLSIFCTTFIVVDCLSAKFNIFFYFVSTIAKQLAEKTPPRRLLHVSTKNIATEF